MDILELLKTYGITDEQSLLSHLKDLSTQDKIELIKILEKKGSYDYTQYEPQAYQEPFHTSGAYIRAMIAANRTGKTYCSMHDLLWYLTGDYPSWFPPSLKCETPFFGRWIATDFKHGIGEVFMPTFKRIVPGPYKEGPVVKRVTKNQTGVWTSIEFQNGSIETLMTNEQDVDDFEGASFHRLDIDEPCSQSRYVASCRGLVDYIGRVCMHLTPLTEPWIYDEVFIKAATDPHIFVVTAGMKDNRYNTQDAMDRFSSNMDCDPDEQEARMEGRFKHLKGIVYKGIDRDIHYINDYTIPGHYPIVHVMDPHDRKPHTMIWAAINEYGHYIIVAELEISGTVLETSRAIKKLERDKRFIVNLRIGDPNKFKAPAAVGQTGSLASEFARYGLTFYTNVNDSIAQGHSAVRQKMHHDKTKPRRLGNQPGLYWFIDGAKKCFAEMMRYTYYESTNQDDHGMKEKPKEAHKDFPDCIRYLVMASPNYEPMNQTIDEIPQTDTRDEVCGY